MLAHDFYHDTHFGRFSVAHRVMYHLAERRFGDVLQNVDFGWYRNFFGELPRTHFHVLLGIGNGSANYAATVHYADGRADVFAIVGCWAKDETGNPVYNAGYLPAVIHEFAHSFVNPVVDQYWPQFTSAQTVFEPVAQQMRALAYGDARSMVHESLVRAATILYFEAKGKSVVGQIANERALGFVWMGDLCRLLRQYEGNRGHYPQFEDFMPAVVECYSSLAPQITREIGI